MILRIWGLHFCFNFHRCEGDKFKIQLRSLGDDLAYVISTAPTDRQARCDKPEIGQSSLVLLL